ncbi:hypothetical protein MXB_2543 [Myxobolus squamalis]|nr:hypothetical protein MXB_2543 [Myxobolus squamalis]
MTGRENPYWPLSRELVDPAACSYTNYMSG